MQLRPTFKRSAWIGLLAGLVFTAGAQATTVYANGGAPGDAFSNATGTNQGQAVGASGWYYNNVRAGGTAGIDTTYAFGGSGSAHLYGPAGAKADIEYLPGAVSVGGNYASTASLGLFTALGGMSYDWYRAASSTAPTHLHPALRVLLDLDGNIATTGDRGGLVFERAYNDSVSPVPTNAWTHQVVGSTTKLWNFGLGLGNEFDIDGDGSQYDTLAEWQASGRLANAVIIGFSAGVGSGWSGTYDGAVDNIGWTIGNQAVTSNFEVAGTNDVPEPATLALLGLGLLGVAATRRRTAAR